VQGKTPKKYCPIIKDYLDVCFTQCPWLLREKCTYDPVIARELADLKKECQIKRY